MLRRVGPGKPAEVAGATIDLLLNRQEHDVGVNVTRRDGDIQVMVIK